MSDAHDHEQTDKEMLARFDPAAELLKAIFGKPEPIRPGTAGFSDELRRLIDRAVELSPAMEELILKIADIAFAEGLDEMEGE